MRGTMRTMEQTDSIHILEKLIAFPTVSRQSNLDLVSYVAGLLDAHGIASRIIQ